MPKPAAQIQLLDDIAGPVAHLRHKFHHPLCCQLKRLQLKNLRADVAVYPFQTEMLHPQSFQHDLHRLSGFQCDTEFAVNLSGADKVVGMRIHARFDAEGNLRFDTQLTSKAVQPLQLIAVVDVNSPMPDCKAYFSSWSVLLCREADAFAGKPAASAVYSSPSETTSRPICSASMMRQISLQQKALLA